MTFRGTVIKGVVVPDAGSELPEGARVSVNPLRSSSRPKRIAATSRGNKKSKTRAKARKAPLTALAGIWKDRPDWKGKSSIQIVAELRRNTGRPRG